MWEADSVSEIKETRRFAPVIPVQCFPPPGCEGSAVGRGGNRQPVSLGGRPVTCWGLGSARRGGGGGGWERSPRRSGTVRGRGAPHRVAGRPGAGMHFSPAGETSHGSGE